MTPVEPLWMTGHAADVLEPAVLYHLTVIAFLLRGNEGGRDDKGSSSSW